MSAPLVVGAVCGRPGCGHGEDLHDGICFGAACECVRFVESAGAFPVPVEPEPSELERLQLRVDEVERAYAFDTAALKRRIAELEAERPRVRTEAIADVGDFLEEVGEKGAAYLVRTVDILAARDPEPDAMTRTYMPVASLREPEGEFYSFLHRDGRVPHDLDETGGTR